MVATLAGHTDTKMIDAVYSHVADDHRYMLEHTRRILVDSQVPKLESRYSPGTPLPLLSY